MSHLAGSDLPIDGRLRLFAALLGAAFAIFELRLFQLQIMRVDELREQALRNSVRTERLDAQRGEIVDREGRILAKTRSAFELDVVPSDLQRRDVTFAALGQLLEREPAELDARLGDPRGIARFRPVRLVGDLDEIQLARVETHRFALPGVSTRVRPLRHYLDGQLAAHLLGTLGEIRGDQLDQEAFADYRSGDIIGQTGLESILETRLRGHSGGRNVMVDAAGREVQVLDEIAPEAGSRVVLTLDLDLQRAAWEAFHDVPEGEPPKMGAAVALDVRTGDVLAMLSQPTFDPNVFSGGIDAATWKALTADEWDPLRNRAIQNHYPPGSTHKVVVAAALLEEGVVDAHTRTFCPGSFRFGGRTYRCWKREGHGSVDLVKAIQQSCDVYFYTFGVQLGIDKLANIARSFGLGQPTGVGLAGEVGGLIPSSEWKERRFGERWYPGETVSAAIGQGYNLYTPLQLAVSYAAIASGKFVRPRLVLRVEGSEGAEESPPSPATPVAVSEAHLALVRRGMTAVVEEPGGTGGRARVPGVQVAGKTGTAQVVQLQHTEGMKETEIPIRYRDHAWFGAFAPADAPEIAVGVFVEHGLHGSSGAGPVVQRILARYFEKRGMTPSPAPARVAGPLAAPPTAAEEAPRAVH
jgi:penicillin-binding protein 2